MSSEKNVRKLEDVSKMVKLAKLHENELTEVTQSLFHSDNFMEFSKYKFIELDNYLLQELSKDSLLFIKGEKKESLVLCSYNQTYELKEAETSNSMLLIPNLESTSERTTLNTSENQYAKETQSKIVSGIFYNYLEVKPCNPRVEKLKLILNETEYKGPENEHSIENTKLVTFSQLIEMIQASEEELKNALDRIKAMEINNYIRLLEFHYHFRILSFMLDLIEENSWPLDEINKETTINSLKEIFPEKIIYKLFDYYTIPSKVKNGKQLFIYVEYNVCRFLAEALLQNTHKLTLSDFNQAWKESVPEGMNVSEDMLDGLAIVEKDITPNVIWMYKAENLPENIASRFRMLFQIKEYWTKEQITPYIKSITTDKTDVNSLLMKYARATVKQGIRYYSGKHGK